MARIRTIKPEIWQDEKLSPLDPITRLVFLALISLADDAGRLVDNLRLLDASIFPETDDTCRDALANLSRIGRIRRGITGSGQRIIQIVNWERHQKVDHPNLKSALPEIVKTQPVTSTRETVANDSREPREPLALHTNDLRPTTSTNEQRPTHAHARADGERLSEFHAALRDAVAEIDDDEGRCAVYRFLDEQHVDPKRFVSWVKRVKMWNAGEDTTKHTAVSWHRIAVGINDLLDANRENRAFTPKVVLSFVEGAPSEKPTQSETDAWENLKRDIERGENKEAS